MRQPPAVGGQLITVLQSVTERDALERQVGEWCRRFTDCESWMRTTLKQHNVVAEDGENTREERPGKAATDDCNFAGLLHAGPHWAQLTRGSGLPVRFIRRSLSMRAGRQLSHAGRRTASHKSAVTTLLSNRVQRWRASSSSDNVGGLKWPSSSSRSSSPLPPRTGMIETTAAPRSIAYSTLRTVHSIDFSAGTCGALSSTKTRSPMPLS